VDVTLTDNENGTGTINLIVEAGEEVRGAAVIVTATVGSITAVTGTDAIFNVFMDQAADNPSIYVIGDVGSGGNPVADPTGNPGTEGLPASVISLCMGIVDDTVPYDQGGATAGTYALGIIAMAGGSGSVVITTDVLRGGIVGDGLTPDADDPLAAGSITTGGGGLCPCNGDSDGNNKISVNDISSIINFLNPAFAGQNFTSDDVPAGKECYNADGNTVISVNDISTIINFLNPTYAGSNFTSPDGVCVP
jgi:hypothetical protein